jgi:hypothetical protein
VGREATQRPLDRSSRAAWAERGPTEGQRQAKIRPPMAPVEARGQNPIHLGGQARPSGDAAMSGRSEAEGQHQSD